MRVRAWMHKGLLLLMTGMLMLSGGLPLAAQEDGFAPAVRVNDRVISQYEMRQRVLMMTLFRQPGDIPTLAMDSLISDALHRDAAGRAEITVSPEQVKAGMTEFASRAKLPDDKFLEALAEGGVAPETLRDFVESGLLWRATIRARFVGTTVISDAEVDRAIGAGAASGGELRVLLTEIILPTGGEVDALTLANRIKLTADTPQKFAMAAQDFSKAPSAPAGGALGWIAISALPPALAPRILALKVGEVTDPIAVTGSVQLFLLRDLSQGSGDAKGATQVDYARLSLPAGSDTTAMRATLDTCDDLYDLGRFLPPEALERATMPEAGLPGDLQGALAALDPGESAVMAAAGGGVTAIVMLCRRQPGSEVPPSRDDVRANLLNAKLGLLASAYQDELRSNAIIRIE